MTVHPGAPGHCPRCNTRLLRDCSEDGPTLTCVACGWEQARAAATVAAQRFIDTHPALPRRLGPRTNGRRL